MLKTLCQLVLLIVAAAPAWAGGVVQTLDARLEGDVAWADGGHSVAGKPVAWDAVVYALPQAVAAGATSGGAMRLDGGEVWRGDIVGLAAKRLTVRSTLLGAREVETDRVRELWFLGAACADGPEAVSSAAAAGTLYRDKGEPIPGTLLWVDETRLAIDSPLGVLTLPREGAVRYSFPAGAAGAKAQVQPAGADLVGLVDGTLLRGAVKPKAGGVEVVHAVLGTLAVPAANIRYVRRSDARVTDLIARLSGAVKEQDILSAGAAGGTRDVRAGDGAAPAGQCLASMRLQPRATAACTLAQGTGKQLRLTGRIEPVPGARGDARLRVTVGGKTVFEKDLAPGAAALPLAVDLPEGGDLGIEVDFGKRIGFPCGVVLEDPLLIVRG